MHKFVIRGMIVALAIALNTLLIPNPALALTMHCENGLELGSQSVTHLTATTLPELASKSRERTRCLVSDVGDGEDYILLLNDLEEQVDLRYGYINFDTGEIFASSSYVIGQEVPFAKVEPTRVPIVGNDGRGIELQFTISDLSRAMRLYTPRVGGEGK